jgi:DNA-binding SARP family transcriptional activator
MIPNLGGLLVGVLGPLEVAADGRPVELMPGRLRALLAVLAMSAGTAVPVDRLAAGVWGDELPVDSGRSLRTYMARLRSVLGVGTIAKSRDGYLLNLAPVQVDALRFLRLMSTREKDAWVERDRLAEGLALWRGLPFEDVPSGWLATVEAPRLVEQYLLARERRIDLDIAEGAYRELAPELSELTARYPVRESLWARHLLVLDRLGRPAEALAGYEAIRARLAVELAVEPGPRLRRIYADLLAGRPVAPAPDTTAVALRAAGPPPRRLPSDVAGFTGRTGYLNHLDALLADCQRQPRKAAVVVVVHGAAGVGKTALAVYWAHRVRERFPGGQLYVNLGGYHPVGTAVHPTDALRTLLDALGVPPRQVPLDLAVQVGLYRSLVADRQVLVVLDNARDADQVRPLLPAGPGCLALVTSRDQLAGLVTSEGAHPVALDLPTADEAHQILLHRVGWLRSAAPPRAVDDIVTRCARLPLALAHVAARATTTPAARLAALATDLHQAPDRLDAFASPDPATDLRAALAASYRAVSPAAARLFRLLGLHPGPDFVVPAAASLAGAPMPRTRLLLAELTRVHLLEEHAPGRYTFHDLLRAYATELSRTSDSHTEHRRAVRRLLDHYLHSAHAATRLLCPDEKLKALASCQPGVTLVDLDDYGQAADWFAAERPAMLATIAYTADAGYDARLWQLGWSLIELLDRHGGPRLPCAVSAAGEPGGRW